MIFADLNDREAHAAAEQSKEIAQHSSYKGIAIRVDITDQASVDDMMQNVLKEYGRIDYCVHSAGVSLFFHFPRPVEPTPAKVDTANLQIANLSGAMTPNIKADMFARTLDTNVLGTMLVVRAVSKAMAAQEPRSYESRRYGTRSLGRGSIVLLGSISPYIAAPGMMPYTSSKHAVIGITKSAGEWPF